MKVHSLEVVTDLGRRVVQLSPPVDFDTSGEMPAHFRSLMEMLWGIICQVAAEGAVEGMLPPKAEA